MSQSDNTFLPDTLRNLTDIDGRNNSGLGDQYGDRDICTNLLLKLQRTEERDISVLQEELYKDEIKENYKSNTLFSEQTPNRIDSVLIKRSSLISKDILKSKNNCFVYNSEFPDEFAPDSDVRYYSPDITKKNKKKHDNHFIPNLPTIKSGHSKYFPVVCLQNCNQVNGRDKISIYEKARLDGEYVKKMGIKMDARCFFASIKAISAFPGKEKLC